MHHVIELRQAKRRPHVRIIGCVGSDPERNVCSNGVVEQRDELRRLPDRSSPLVKDQLHLAPVDEDLTRVGLE